MVPMVLEIEVKVISRGIAGLFHWLPGLKKASSSTADSQCFHPPIAPVSDADVLSALQVRSLSWWRPARPRLSALHVQPSKARPGGL